MKIICCGIGFYGRGGLGAFRMDVHKRNDVYQYIANQKEHHKRMNFGEEYEKLLKMFEIDYDEGYLFIKPE